MTIAFRDRATMAALFRNVAASYPNREALVADGGRFTFAQIDARSDQLAEALRLRGLGRGSVIGAILLEGVAMVELLIAAAKLGATVLAVNWRISAQEIRYIVDDARPDFCFVSETLTGLVEAASPGCERIVVQDASVAGASAALGLTDASPRLTASHAVEPGDRWYMLYTSGTTGKPKGCQHSQGAYHCNILAVAAALGVRPEDRFLLTSPLFHVGGLSNFLARYISGSATVIPPRGGSVEAQLHMISDEAITMIVLPYLDAEAFIEAQRRLRLPLKLRTVMAGAGQHKIDLLTDIADVLQTDLMLGYGQSEAGGFISFISLADQKERPTSCGRPVLGLSARIVNAAGEDMPVGETGELLLAGPSIMMGYLNLPDETGAAIGDGWLRTGDLFWRDADGFLFFAGRDKELVKTGGENVYPLEVEQILLRHDRIVDACVVGVPHPRWGEAVKAFAVLAPGAAALAPAALADWCRGQIAGYKRPRFVEFVDHIPRNAQGKPDRRELGSRPVEPSQATDTI